MKRNFYNFISNAKHLVLAFGLTVVSTSYAQQTFTLNYTGSVQTLTLPVGSWSIECWGANGGSITTLGGNGMGGYSGGKLQVTSPATLNIYVGGRGGPATGNTSSAGAGGWNGGGGGAAVGRSGAGGGGGTDVRLNGNAASDRIIVAGGGGGAAYYGSSLISASVAAGGNGGSTTGGNGNIIASSGLITINGGGQGANGATPGSASFITSNGTTSGGGGGAFSGGSIGQQGTGGGAGGAAGTSGSGSTGSSAGGGGGYAGGAGGTQSGNTGVAGGGGSGYIGGVTNGVTTMFGQSNFVANPVTNGHGVVVITELCSVQAFAATGTNSLNPEICPGDFVVLSSNAVGNYSWSNGATTNTIMVSPTTSTFYTITGTGSLNCTETGTITVTVNSGPTLNVVATNTLICAGEAATLTASGADNYQWAGGPATAQYTVSPLTSGVFTVTGMHNVNTCTTEITIPVGVVIPNVAAPTSTQVCAGNSVTLTASGASTYTWSGISTGPSGVFVFQPIGTATVVLGATTTSLTASCPTTHTFMVTMLPLPTLTATAKRTMSCVKESNTLTVNGALTYTWSDTNTGSVNVVSPNSSTVYTVTGTDVNGCNGSTQVFAYVNICSGIEDKTGTQTTFEVYPNPNEGQFVMKSDKAMELILLNQLGQQLQIIRLDETNNYSQEMNVQTAGVYFVVPTQPGSGILRKIIVH